MGKAWGITEAWRDSQRVEFSDARLAKAIGVSQANFPTLQYPKSLPSREIIGSIAYVIDRPFRGVLDAFLSDLGYDSPPTRQEIENAVSVRKDRAERKDSPASRAAEKASKPRDGIGEESQDPAGFDPA